MTNRKPPGVGWESWVDQLIRESRERGEFDDLAGAGKPIPGLDRPHDEMWWVRQKLRSEGVSYLPPSLAVRKEKDLVLERIETLRSESAVRELLEELNAEIRKVNRNPTPDGPPSTLMPLDVEEVVASWRERRELATAEQAAAERSPADDPAEPAPRSARPRLWPRRRGSRAG